MRREHYFNPIARQQPDKISNLLRARMGQNQTPVLQLHAKDPIRHGFHNPRLYGLVSTQGPFSVTATQCS
jgi:hypothetical protein